MSPPCCSASHHELWEEGAEGPVPRPGVTPALVDMGLVPWTSAKPAEHSRSGKEEGGLGCGDISTLIFPNMEMKISLGQSGTLATSWSAILNSCKQSSILSSKMPCEPSAVTHTCNLRALGG